MSAPGPIETFRRTLRFLRPFRARLAIKIALSCSTAIPVLLLPWPLKILIDGVIVGDGLASARAAAASGSGTGSEWPFFVRPLVDALTDASPERIVATVAGIFVASIVLFGAMGGDARRRDEAGTPLSSGMDNATRAENQANGARSQVSGLLGWIEYRFSLRLVQDINHRLRTQTFERMLRLPFGDLDERRTGDAVYRLMIDAPGVSFLAMVMLVSPFRQAIAAAFSLWLLATSYGAVPEVLWASLATLPLAALVSFVFSGPVRRRAVASREAGATTTSGIEEGVSGVAAVQSLGGSERESARFDRDSRESYRRFRDYFLSHLGAVLVALGVGLPLLLFLFYRITDGILDGRLTVGDFPVIWAYVFRVLIAFGTLAWLPLMAQDSLAGLARVFELWDRAPGDDDNRPELAPVRESVRIEHASYAYPDGTVAIDDVSLEARVGEIVAIVGPTGAGKTTLASLVPRFLSPATGRVAIDGVDVASVSFASLSRQVAFVFQEPMLLDATIAENLRLGRPDASDEALERAARAAGAHDFVAALPDGYDTRLARGAGLSMGQRQRLSIARALVRDTPILILDEPTAALDPATERHLVEALDHARARRIVIVIAHRLSTIRAADRIAFLEGGRVVETGSHDALMADPESAYRRFVLLQSRGAA